MMKKRTLVIFALIIFSFLALTGGSAKAQIGPGMMFNYGSGKNIAQSGNIQVSNNTEINAALQTIYQSQNVSALNQITCSKVTNQQFATLGDAYMSLMVPNRQSHEAMDNMMGGEGSASLEQAHISMGRSYLGCWSGYNGTPAVSMMGYVYGTSTLVSSTWPYYGMMDGYGYNRGWNGNGGWGMMGFGGVWTWFGWLTMVLAWIFLALGIAVLVKWLRRK